LEKVLGLFSSVCTSVGVRVIEVGLRFGLGLVLAFGADPGFTGETCEMKETTGLGDVWGRGIGWVRGEEGTGVEVVREVEVEVVCAFPGWTADDFVAEEGVGVGVGMI
jgi:hypothetical protein